jgi:hypothetical protein
MAETQRTKTAALALLADNATEAISPEDIRDGFLSFSPGFGALYVSTAGAVTVSADTTFYEATGGPAWSTHGPTFWFDESDGDGRLTYTGAAAVTGLFTCTFSCSTTGSSQTLGFELRKNGTSEPQSYIERFLSAGTDTGAVSVQVLTALTTGDHVSMWVQNQTAANDITIAAGVLSGFTFPT